MVEDERSNWSPVVVLLGAAAVVSVGIWMLTAMTGDRGESAFLGERSWDVRFGPKDASEQVVVFGECATAATLRTMKALQAIQRERPEDVSILWKDAPQKEYRQAGYLAAKLLHASELKGPRRQGLAQALWELPPNALMGQIIELGVRHGISREKAKIAVTGEQSPETLQGAIKDAEAAGVRGTPVVFINGLRLKSLSEEELRRQLLQETSSS